MLNIYPAVICKQHHRFIEYLQAYASNIKQKVGCQKHKFSMRNSQIFLQDICICTNLKFCHYWKLKQVPNIKRWQVYNKIHNTVKFASPRLITHHTEAYIETDISIIWNFLKHWSKTIITNVQAAQPAASDLFQPLYGTVQ